MITWGNINSIGKLKILNSSYVVFVFLPIIIKFMQCVPESIPLGSGGHIRVYLSLPFNWILLYFSALFFSIGKLSYTLFCPKIIKYYGTFKVFKESGETPSFLYNEFVMGMSKDIKNKNTSDMVRYYIDKGRYKLIPKRDKDEIDNITYLMDPELKIEESRKDDAFKSAYHFVIHISQTRNKKILNATFASISLGVVLAAMIIFQNIYYVVRYLINMAF